MSVGIRGTDEFTGSHDNVNISQNKLHIAQYVWDTSTLSWVRQVGTSGGPSSDVVVTNLPSIYRTTAYPYTIRFDEYNSEITYYGEAPAGSFENSAVWLIKRMTIVGSNVISIKYADGNSNFDNIWANRYSLTYI